MTDEHMTIYTDAYYKFDCLRDIIEFLHGFVFETDNCKICFMLDHYDFINI